MDIKDSHILAPFVATDSLTARRMLKIAEPKPGDVLFDIGCGEGSIILEAAKPEYNLKKVVGIEYNHDRVERVIRNLKDFDFEDRVEIIHDDAFKVDFSKINPDIVTMYLTLYGMVKLKPKLESELKKGTKIVSNSNKMEGWNHSKSSKIYYEDDSFRKIFLYKIGETGEKRGFLDFLMRRYRKKF